MTTTVTDYVNSKTMYQCIPGVWVEGKVYWLNKDTEELIIQDQLNIRKNFVNNEHNTAIWELEISNSSRFRKKAMAIFQYFLREDTEQISFISPLDNVIYLYGNGGISLINGRCIGAKGIRSVQPLMNVFGNEIWSCKSSGTLKYNPMTAGFSTGFVAFGLEMDSGETKSGKSWMINGQDERKLLQLNDLLLQKTTSISV